MVATIILPYADRADLLTDSLRSIFAQTVAEWELILVNDGADGHSAKVASSVRDARVRHMGDTRRLGLAARLNEAIDAVNTPFVVRMDADDIMFPHRLEKLLNILMDRSATGSRADVIGSRAVAIDDQTRILGIYRESDLPSTPAGFLESNAFTHPTVAGRTAWFQENRYRNSLRRAQDKELWLRTASYSNFRKLSETLLFYRIPRVIRGDLYTATQRVNRSILREYGPSLIGWPRTAVKLTTAHVKEWVARSFVGHKSFDSHYIQRRYDASVIAPQWTEALDRVLRTGVPGVTE